MTLRIRTGYRALLFWVLNVFQSRCWPKFSTNSTCPLEGEGAFFRFLYVTRVPMAQFYLYSNLYFLSQNSLHFLFSMLHKFTLTLEWVPREERRHGHDHLAHKFTTSDRTLVFFL